jgi:hypothetical protein
MMGLAQAAPILQGECDWQYAAMDKVVAEMLPANERRRTTALIKLALKVGQDAMPGIDAASHIATVFASSEGDLEITDKICRALLQEDKPVSPTQFHNSVHNAAAGYWAIAARSQQPSISLSAGDASFAAGLLEAVSQVLLDGVPVLLLAYDLPAPPPLDAERHFDFPFATAMLVASQPTENCLAGIELTVNHQAEQPGRCQNPSLEKVRQGNPIAASLPMLEALLATQSASVALPYLDQQTVTVQVWH